MAEIRDAIRHRVLSKTAITSLISQRCYPEIAATDAILPLIVIATISDNVAIRSASGSTGVHRCRIQFTIRAASVSSRGAVKEAIRNALDGYRGSAGSATTGIFFVQDCRLDNSIDDLDESPENDARQTYVATVDYEVWYEAGTPNNLA